jgi:uncharacterized protein with GYD domain
MLKTFLRTNRMKEKEISPDVVKVRILTTCTFGQVDTVQILSADDAQQAVAAGLADDNPDAVAYAETLAVVE